MLYLLLIIPILSLALLDYFFIVRAYDKIFGKIKFSKSKRLAMIIISVIIIGVSFIRELLHPSLITDIVFLSFLLLFLYPANFKKKFFIIINVYTSKIALQDIFRETSFFLLENNVLLKNNFYFDICFTLVCHIILWIILFIMSKLCRYREERVNVSNGFFLITLIFPAIIMISQLGFAIFISPTPGISNLIINKLIYMVGFSSWTMIILVNLLLLYVYGEFEEEQISSVKRTMLEMELVNKKNHYKEVEHMQSQIRSIYHDLRNQIDTLSYLLFNDDIEGAKEILKLQNEKIEKTDKLICSNNSSIDSVLNLKIEEAKLKDIEVSYNITIPQDMKLKYGYMVIIIANILDNAIEANLKLDGQRYIKISMKYINNMLIAKISNPYDEKIHHLGNKKTTKKDKIYHGYGLENIKNAVAEMGGSLDIEQKNGEYSVSFVLYNIEV